MHTRSESENRKIEIADRTPGGHTHPFHLFTADCTRGNILLSARTNQPPCSPVLHSIIPVPSLSLPFSLKMKPHTHSLSLIAILPTTASLPANKQKYEKPVFSVSQDDDDDDDLLSIWRYIFQNCLAKYELK